MKVATLAVIGGVIFFGGCANHRTFRQGGAPGTTTVPDSTPSLGLPSPTLPGQNNSSPFGPGHSVQLLADDP